RVSVPPAGVGAAADALPFDLLPDRLSSGKEDTLVPRSIPGPRAIAQLLLALSLATVLALGAVVAASAPARAALAHSASAVAAPISPELSHASHANTLADTPQTPCIGSGGGCP